MNEDLIYSNGFGKHSIYHSKQKKSSSNIYLTSSFMVTKIRLLYLNKGQINFGGINVARKRSTCSAQQCSFKLNHLISDQISWRRWLKRVSFNRPVCSGRNLFKWGLGGSNYLMLNKLWLLKTIDREKQLFVWRVE